MRNAVDYSNRLDFAQRRYRPGTQCKQEYIRRFELYPTSTLWQISTKMEKGPDSARA
jgi:hypothetical protein